MGSRLQRAMEARETHITADNSAAQIPGSHFIATIEQAGSKWGDREGRGTLDSGLVSSPILSDWLLKLIQL